MNKAGKITLGVAAIAVVAAGGFYYYYKTSPAEVRKYGGLALNEIRTLTAPDGTITIERNADAGGGNGATTDTSAVPTSDPLSGQWPSYNRTPSGDRFSPLGEITPANAAALEVKCSYDTGDLVAFETGPIMVDGALVITTQKDIIRLDPDNCKEVWRTHENVPDSGILVNRGAAYGDGTLYRGMEDGDVIAYDFKTGKKLWTTNIADASIGESVPSAPLFWKGKVFVGTAGGDNKGVKGRMYALDAKTGKIDWELYLVPYQKGDKTRGPLVNTPLDGSTWKTGKGIPISGGGTWTHYTIDPASGTLYIPGGNPAPDFDISVREGDNLYSGSVLAVDAETGKVRQNYLATNQDWHDWDVSNAPIIAKTRGGQDLLVATPKDGQVYGFDRATGKLVYKVAATTRKNPDERFAVGKKVSFCPGTVGGAEWNSPSYAPTNNLILTGQVDWCYSVTLDEPKDLAQQKNGTPWTGMASINPLNTFGRAEQSDKTWGGWVYALDADTGEWSWRAHLNYPVTSGVTPTAGGVTFFGDMGGNIYALNTATGDELYHYDAKTAVAGGVISYEAPSGGQRIAVATGMTSPIWPTKNGTAKLYVFGLPNS
ncbi:pyrroloquinoline quinone-dependent dehydrogenase [Croceicoccus sediminis]|uniref:pyrroloquinoline quinone-dependent dehydrogenase n=1 Tax=Croceicoccus sediminis TaxID=2571150 RepID=UPI0011828827|nr:PQQ-binding-like beta-propeller repeat protein [Croceicoccus sediminis]